MCFIGHNVPSKLNRDPILKKQIDETYIKQYLSKILEEKDILKQAQESKFRNAVRQEDIFEAQSKLEEEIYRLQKIDERKITDLDVSRA